MIAKENIVQSLYNTSCYSMDLDITGFGYKTLMLWLSNFLL